MKKLCKRMLAMITALVLVAGIFTAIPVFGSWPWMPIEPYFNVSVLSQSAAPGQYVDVVLLVTSHEVFVNTLGLTVAYDSNVLQSVSVIQGNAATLPAPPSGGENPMQLNFYSINHPYSLIGGVGSLAAIRFRIHDNAPSGSTPITVTPAHAYAGYPNLVCQVSFVGITQGIVNICSPYCECLNCANESDLSNLLMVVYPFLLHAQPRHANRWQAHIGDLGLPATVNIIVTPFEASATASISWSPPILHDIIYPAWGWGIYFSIGTVILPSDVTNNNAVPLTLRAWMYVFCLPTCDCPICEYEAWRAEIERQRVAYEEWREWERAVEHARIEHEAYIVWRTAVEEAEAAHQAYLDWLAEIERQRVAYEEWRDWLCATNQCDQCDRCN